MIAGTIVIEDLTLHFSVEPGEVSVRVTNTGETGLVVCSPRAWAASLALALDPDAMSGADAESDLYGWAGTIKFPSPGLRWIP